MSDTSSEILTKSFLSNYKNKQIPWGFNGLGYIVYKRTYSRLKIDGNSEEWWETIERCINGAQKIGAKYTKEEAETLFDLIFNLKCMFSGRSLWQLGTNTVDRFGGNSLLSCWFVTINEPKAFEFLFENLMLGGGVGFSVKREHVNELPRIKFGVKIVHENTTDADLIVADSRQGWIRLLHYVLKSFFENGKSFSYSTILVRGAGEPIKGFGGTASGPQILIEGIEKICKIFKGREGKKLRSIDALDICNIIGSIVVAGNVRRCLPENSLIHSKTGLIKIQDIKVGDEVLTSDGYFPVKNVFAQGKQKLIKIITQDGEFICTPNHKMAVLSDPANYTWIEASELKENDRLISSREPIEGQVTSLPSWNYIKPKHSTTCQNIIIPILDEKMAWFLGVFQADGYCFINNNSTITTPNSNCSVSLVFQLNEKDIAEKAKKQLERFGLNNVKLDKRKNENSLMVSCASKQIANYFYSWLKQPKTPLNIPPCILNGTQKIKLAYLHGLFDGDGAANNRPVCLVTTCYENFAKQIQTLAYSCGFETRLKKNKKWESRKNWQILYHVVFITKYSKDIFGRGYGIKQTRKSLLSQRANSYPCSWFKEASGKIKKTFGISSNNNFNIDSYISVYKETKLCPVSVLSVEQVEQQAETFDIEVESKHEFFCNGYLTHNSAQISIGDPDDYLFLRAKRWDLGNIPNWRAMSNNTVGADDYSQISSEVWEGYQGNGEPYGLFNLPLSQKCGRINEVAKDSCEGTNPCAEISLSNYECCNLAELYLNNISSPEELVTCAKLLYKTQKAIAALPFIHEETNKIVRKNMRLGLGVTGICQSLDKVEWLDKCYVELRKFDKEWSKQNNYPESIKLTTTKPSGTISILSGSTPGIHPAFARYYIRRVRMSSSDVLVSICRQSGYKIEYALNFDGSENRDTVVVEFPCECFNAVLAKDMSAVKQLELVKKIQTVWADNAVSVTVYYKKEELAEIKAWLKENYKENIKSVSFLLHSEHGFKQAPYSEISENEYNLLIKGIKKVNKLIDLSNGEALDGIECSSGVCPIK